MLSILISLLKIQMGEIVIAAVHLDNHEELKEEKHDDQGKILVQLGEGKEEKLEILDEKGK